MNDQLCARLTQLHNELSDLWDECQADPGTQAIAAHLSRAVDAVDHAYAAAKSAEEAR